MFISNNEALELGLLLRAIMYALLFLGMAVIVWNAGDTMFRDSVQGWLIKAFSFLCFAVGIVNIFMAIEWFIVYFA